MAAKRETYRADLQRLIESALKNGDGYTLETYLVKHGTLSRTMLNLPMAHAFADSIGEIVVQDARAEGLLDQWAALSADVVPFGNEREILPCAAALAYGQVAVACRERWDEIVEKLHRAASDSRWRIREMVAAAFQRMLPADWDRAEKVLKGWLSDGDPLVIRAVAAAVAEPPILTDERRGESALAIQAGAAEWFAKIPASRRREEKVKVLRQGLGFTLSVAVAAAPEPGFVLLEKLAAMDDKDIQWIVRENLKKHRLSKWPERVKTVEARLG